MIEETYAEALRKMVARGETPKAAVSLLHKSLTRHGRTALLPRIGRAFKRIAERERMSNILTLSVAKAQASHAKSEAKGILSVMNIDPKDVETRVDATLIGGWRLEGREHLFDTSFKKHLLALYNRTIQS